ncbi:MAG: glycosyltransferase family 1 protein [Candidatus Parvarchaeota archaeon]
MSSKKISILNDVPTFTGIGQYSIDLAKMLASNNIEVDYVSFEDTETPLKNFSNIRVRDPLHNFKYKSVVYRNTAFNLLAFSEFVKGDVHITSQFLIPLGVGRRNVVITVHDITQFHTIGKDAVGTFLHIGKLGMLSKYRHIVVDSNFVKQDILNHLNVDEESIDVLYNWIDLSKIHVRQNSNTMKMSKKIKLLHVGNDQPNKNISLLYKVMKNLPPNFELIRVGNNSLRNLRYVDRNNLKRRISFYSRISMEELEQLYLGSDCFVYPSSFEGFGRPLLEAMAHGLPIVYRDGSSLSEIAGDAGLKFYSDDPDEISELIYKATTEGVAEELRKRSIERSKLFDIKKQEEKIINYYKRVFPLE